MGFGTFDGVHPGHINYLKQLKELGDELIVVISRDANVKKIKDRLPDKSEVVRKKEVEKTGIPDKVILGDGADFYLCIKEYKPDIVGLGYDQAADTESLVKLFPGLQIIRMKAHEPHIHKSSLLKNAKNPKCQKSKTLSL